MSKHTPGPWYTEEQWGRAKDDPPEKLKLCFYSIHSQNGDYVASTWGEPHLANANHIVKCVNMHDDMLAILKKILSPPVSLEKMPLCSVADLRREIERVVERAEIK